MLHPPPPPKFQVVVTPPGSTYDPNGYVQPPPGPPPSNTWTGRVVSAIDAKNQKMIEKQRQLGYQYYDQDPGRDPNTMNPYEQSQVAGTWFNSCTVL